MTDIDVAFYPYDRGLIPRSALYTAHMSHESSAARIEMTSPVLITFYKTL